MSRWPDDDDIPQYDTSAQRPNNVVQLPPPKRPLVESAADFIARYVPVDYVVDGLLIRGYLYGLTSRPNHGKTSVATALAIHVANGQTIAGMEVQGGTVLAMFGENSENSRLMLIGASQHFCLPTTNIEVISRAEPIEDCIGEIIAACKSPDYALVIVDSSASYFSGGDENDNVQAGNHARALRRLTELPGNPAVLICCHPTKSADRENMLPRGGSAFLAEIDTNLTIWSDDGTIEIGHTKVRGPVIDTMSLALKIVTLGGLTDRKGRPVTAPVADPMSESQAEFARKSTIESDNRVLYAMLHDPKATQSELARSCGFVTKDGVPEKYKIRRAQLRLQADNLAGTNRYGWFLTAAGKKEAENID